MEAYKKSGTIKKTTPKVKFCICPKADMVYLFCNFLDDKDPEFIYWANTIYRVYPDLKTKLEGVRDKQEKEGRVTEFVDKIFEADKKVLQEKVGTFQMEWDKIGDRALIALSEVVEQDWSAGDAQIKARVSINPVCPRYLEARQFDVFYKFDPESVKDVVIHEILHFIYFKKWESVFPDTPKEEFESPHLVWKLSEMMPGVVLNDERIQNVFRHQFKAYDRFEKLRIDGKPLMAHLKELYDSRKDFEGFLRKSFAFVKRHEKEINSLVSS